MLFVSMQIARNLQYYAVRVLREVFSAVIFMAIVRRCCGRMWLIE